MESAEIVIAVVVPILVVILTRAFLNTKEIGRLSDDIKQFCNIKQAVENQGARITKLTKAYALLNKRLGRIEHILKVANGKGNKSKSATENCRDSES